MLSKISLLTALIFSITYPFCFWISVKDPLRQNFHHFHIGLPCFVAGITAAVVLLSPMSAESKGLIAGWAVLLFSFSYLSWSRPYPHPALITMPSVFGLNMLPFIFQEILGTVSGEAVAASILGGFVFSAALYAMNLGHWYLNVHGLPIKHLRWATHVLGAFLGLRVLTDAFVLSSQKIIYQGEEIGLYNFMVTPDGIFLWIAVFFGTVFPLCSLYFVYGTLKVKNTQSATGILYVILSAVLIGDLSYKYYLMRYGLPL